MRIKKPLLALALPALLSVLPFEPVAAFAQRIVAVYPGDPDTSKPGSITVFDTNGVVTNISDRFVSGPYGVATDSRGNIYVGNTANGTNSRVAKYGPDYHLINPALFYTPTNSPPGALAVDPYGYIYVSPYPEGAISKYDPDGILVTNKVKGRIWGFAPEAFGNSTLACDRNGNVYTIGGERDAPGLHEYNGSVLIRALPDSPGGIATDAAGNVYQFDASGSAPNSPVYVFKTNPMEA